MRNLKEYPVTSMEIHRILNNELEKLQAAELIGDTRPIALKWIIEYLAINDVSFEEFLKTK